jgi:hypothetical protein
MWLLPSLNRPHNLARFFEAFGLTSGSTPGMVLTDDVDYQKNYRAYDELDLPIGWHIRRTKGRTQGDKIREVWGEISSCAWFGLIGDDNIPETSCWDRRLVDALDGWNIVSCDDGWQAPKRIANCWVIGGDLVRELGYIFAPGIHHLFVDDMWEIIGKEASNWRCLMDVMVRHAHVMKGDAEADTTHKAAYGDGFTAEHQGPDRANGLWAGDEVAYRAWLDGDRHRIVATIRGMGRRSEPEIKRDEVIARRLERARSRNVMICTPIARHPCWQYMLSLMDTMSLLNDNGMGHARQFVIGSSNLPRARNELVARFLASKCTDLLFVDDDMAWSANSVLRLLASDKPITAVVGRKRVDKPNSDPDVWCGQPYTLADGHSLVQDDMGFVRYKRCGTAFMRISREVFEKMMVAHPEWKRKGHSGMSDLVKSKYYRFFQFGEDEFETGEDYEFCNAWTAIGGEVWVDPEAVLSHIGDKAYTGSLAESGLMQVEEKQRLEAAE